jgi:hypothetical protein
MPLLLLTIAIARLFGRKKIKSRVNGTPGVRFGSSCQADATTLTGSLAGADPICANHVTRAATQSISRM